MGPGGVLAVSVLMGLLFGGLYRYARTVSGLFGAAVLGYVVYYTVYMTYDNMLSFSVIAVYELAVVFAVARFSQVRARPST
jgi:hypothetical protein